MVEYDLISGMVERQFLVVNNGVLMDFEDGIPVKQINDLAAGDSYCVELIDEIERFHLSRFTIEFYVHAVRQCFIGRRLYELYKKEHFRVQRVLDVIVPHTMGE